MIDQTTFYDPSHPKRGNCTQAAVASILGLQLQEVPDFMQAGSEPMDFWMAFEDFLRSKGLEPILMPANFAPDCLYLASGPSARGCPHMVVMRDGHLVHDPHPARTGIQEVHHVYLLVPQNLSTYAR